MLDLGGSATDLGIVLAAHSLLITALVLAGGVFADRISPRLAMLRADVVRTLAMAAMAALLIAGVAEIWQLALLYAIEGAATAFFNPASNAIVPQVVAAERLQEANALLDLSRSVGHTVGPALAGVLLALGTPGWALAVDAATFALSAAFLYRLRVPPKPAAEAPAFLSELRHGWREFSSRTWLWAIVLSAAITNAVFFPAFQVLGPVVANDSLGGSGAWALIAAALGAGSIAGGLVALRIRAAAAAAGRRGGGLHDRAAGRAAGRALDDRPDRSRRPDLRRRDQPGHDPLRDHRGPERAPGARFRVSTPTTGSARSPWSRSASP